MTIRSTRVSAASGAWISTRSPHAPLQGGTDEEIFDAIFADRLPLNEERVRAWNAFLRKRGLRDECSAEIAELKQANGWADRDDIQTYMDFQDADEGRTPRFG